MWNEVNSTHVVLNAINVSDARMITAQGGNVPNVASSATILNAIPVEAVRAMAQEP
jgi:hypothetical protein